PVCEELNPASRKLAPMRQRMGLYVRTRLAPDLSERIESHRGQGRETAAEPDGQSGNADPNVQERCPGPCESFEQPIERREDVFDPRCWQEGGAIALSMQDQGIRR